MNGDQREIMDGLLEEAKIELTEKQKEALFKAMHNMEIEDMATLLGLEYEECEPDTSLGLGRDVL